MTPPLPLRPASARRVGPLAAHVAPFCARERSRRKLRLLPSHKSPGSTVRRRRNELRRSAARRELSGEVRALSRRGASRDHPRRPCRSVPILDSESHRHRPFAPSCALHRRNCWPRWVERPERHAHVEVLALAHDHRRVRGCQREGRSMRCRLCREARRSRRADRVGPSALRSALE